MLLRNQKFRVIREFKNGLSLNMKLFIFIMFMVQDKSQLDQWLIIGIFEYHFRRNKPLPVVKPGTQKRRFTHIDDTVAICYEAWKKNKCAHYSISNKKSYSIKNVAKMFNSKIIYIKKRPGERYLSALTKISLNNKIFRRFGKIKLKDYISSFIKG